MKKSRVFLVLLVLLVTLLAGCANQNGEGAAIADIRQLDGQTIGVMTGSTFDQHTDTYINDAKKEYYTTYADMALAVEQGKIAAFLMDEPMARVLCAENPGVTYLEDYLTEDGYAFAFPKTEQGALLRDQMNEFLARIRRYPGGDRGDLVRYRRERPGGGGLDRAARHQRHPGICGQGQQRPLRLRKGRGDRGLRRGYCGPLLQGLRLRPQFT